MKQKLTEEEITRLRNQVRVIFIGFGVLIFLAAVLDWLVF